MAGSKTIDKELTDDSKDINGASLVCTKHKDKAMMTVLRNLLYHHVFHTSAVRTDVISLVVLPGGADDDSVPSWSSLLVPSGQVVLPQMTPVNDTSDSEASLRSALVRLVPLRFTASRVLRLSVALERSARSRMARLIRASSRLARPPGTRRGGWSSGWRREAASSPATTRQAPTRHPLARRAAQDARVPPLLGLRHDGAIPILYTRACLQRPDYISLNGSSHGARKVRASEASAWAALFTPV